MMPVIAWNALHATRILRAGDARAARPLRRRIEADEARCRELLDRSTALATALSPYIGYAATAEIAKTSVQTGRSIRELVRERRLLPDDAARRDPLGGSDDIAGRAGTERTMTRQRRSRGARASLALALVAPLAPRGAAQRGCSARRTSAMLEGPDRDAWQRPDQIMDALRHRRGQRRR